MESIDNIIKKREKPKVKSERAELIKFFVDRLENKNKKPFPARLIAIKLSHLSIKDLHYFKSVCSDIENRKGKDAMGKYFWFSLKSPIITNKN